jgi:hypothetical protein
MPGRDRRHYMAELRKARNEHDRLMREATAAHDAADRQLAIKHRLDCEAWSARQFCGGPEDPSPTIEQALNGAYERLEVQCWGCNHADTLDLAVVVWPRSRPVHTLKRALYCAKCLKDY